MDTISWTARVVYMQLCRLECNRKPRAHGGFWIDDIVGATEGRINEWRLLECLTELLDAKLVNVQAPGNGEHDEWNTKP